MVNEGLKRLQEEIKKDSLASKPVELALITFNSEVKVVQDFATVDQFTAPLLEARASPAWEREWRKHWIWSRRERAITRKRASLTFVYGSL